MDPVDEPDDASLRKRRAETVALEQRTAKARADLDAVLADLSQAQEQLGSHRVHQLLAANEQLVIDAVRSRALAEAAAERVSELTRSTEFDALTGLPNRLLLFDRLNQALTHAKRHDGKLALMFIDLDGFKLINDTLGHQVGDAVLRAVGRCLNECVRQVDTVCRLGGDEFVVLLTEITQAADSTLVAEKLLDSLAQLGQVDGVPVQVSASIGISVFPDDATDLDALVDCADKAMYRCKRSGGGRHYFFSAPDSNLGTLSDSSEVSGIPLEAKGQAAMEQRLSSMQASVERQEAELDELRKASANKDEFLSVLGHELRNPLAPVITTLDLMRLRAGGNETAEHSTIRRHLNHVVCLVDDLQDVAKIATGKVVLRLRPMPIDDAVLEAIAIAKPLLEERQQSFNFEAAPVTITCMVDSVRLEQCISNLLINATKYTPPRGTITLSTRQEGETAVISVADNGRGISAGALPRVFDLFFQERSDVRQHEPGLGVGLALVRSLVSLHSGTVSVHSEGLGCGSEFIIRLPVLVGGDTLPGRLEGISATVGERAPLQRILIVDDNYDVADSLAMLLRLYGHEVSVATHPAVALRLVAKLKPDIALLDIGLPEMDGYELASQIRERHPGLPVTLVAVSGYSQGHAPGSNEGSVFQAHLIKPVQIDELERVLREGRPPSTT